jgi:hypothetical protein
MSISEGKAKATSGTTANYSPPLPCDLWHFLAIFAVLKVAPTGEDRGECCQMRQCYRGGRGGSAWESNPRSNGRKVCIAA